MYTDGSALGNPGRGGFGIVMVEDINGKDKITTHSSGFILTTNNRMELMGILIGLTIIKNKANISIFSDSQYCVNGIMKWMQNWSKNKWYKNGSKIKNADLWEQVYNKTKHHNVHVEWVKAHNGDEYNEQCDKLAKDAARNGTFIDNAYVKSQM